MSISPRVSEYRRRRLRNAQHLDALEDRHHAPSHRLARGPVDRRARREECPRQRLEIRVAHDVEPRPWLETRHLVGTAAGVRRVRGVERFDVAQHGHPQRAARIRRLRDGGAGQSDGEGGQRHALHAIRLGRAAEPSHRCPVSGASAPSSATVFNAVSIVVSALGNPIGTNIGHVTPCDGVERRLGSWAEHGNLPWTARRVAATSGPSARSSFSMRAGEPLHDRRDRPSALPRQPARKWSWLRFWMQYSG